MMDVLPVDGRQDPEQDRALHRLVSALRARGGVGTVGESCRQDLSEVDGAVLTIFADHAGRIVFSDSGPYGDQLEDLQASLDEGPGIDALGNDQTVLAPDLDHAQARLRWPRLVEQALTCGIRAVFAYPVHWHNQPVGVLSLYRAVPGPLSPAGHERAQQYADAATILLADDLHVTEAGVVEMVLPIHAVETQQAIGVVMEYADVDAATALHRLRAYAWHSARRMRDVVAEVRTCQLPFDATTPT